MSCTNPIYSLDLGLKENGKRNIKILPRRVDVSSLVQLEARYGKGSLLPLPCGKCLACRLSKAREWAVRCVLEASLYENNSFITLTYDDAYLPADGKLKRKHLQDFLKRLRSYHDVRYFGCGEYGGSGSTICNGVKLEHGRPHYHLIIFGWFPDDFRNGRSKELEKLWPFGYSYVDECNFRTCDYVARYTTKKLFKKDDDSFICMSIKPGLGYAWLQKHFDIFDNDRIYGSFGSGNVSNIPRYFEKIFEVLDPEKLKELKEMRIEKGSDIKLYEMLVHGLDHIEKLYDYKNAIQVHEFEQKGKRKEL